jgi:RecB family exonuclease
MRPRLYYPPVEDDWRPPEARLRGALWEAERWLRVGSYAAAGAALEGVTTDATGDAAAVVRGLRLLAAAGYRRTEGDAERAARLLARAREQLTPYVPVYEDVDLADLADLVEAAIRS